MNSLIRGSSSEIVKESDGHKPLARALSTLDGQVDAQADQITEQAMILYQRMLTIQENRRKSLIIYASEIGFRPIVMNTYHLYKSGSRQFISMVGPMEWGRRMREQISWIATIKLAYDHTWEIIELNDPDFFAQ